jgi:hypothetical protein
MERSIGRNNPSDLGAFQEVRRQYRNMLPLEKAATGAGEDAALGLVSPSQLRNAVVQQNRRAYARGQGDYADLARAGEAIMKPLPNSGTAPREYMMKLPERLLAATGIGTGMGATAGGPVGAGIGAAAGAGSVVLPPIMGSMLMSQAGQAWLANQLLGAGRQANRPVGRAIAGSILDSLSR